MRKVSFIILGIAVFTLTQIFFYVLNSCNASQTYKTRHERSPSQDNHIYSTDVDWTQLVRIMEILRHRNQTLYLSVIKHAFMTNDSNDKISVTELKNELTGYLKTGKTTNLFNITKEKLKEFALTLTTKPNTLKPTLHLSKDKLNKSANLSDAASSKRLHDPDYENMRTRIQDNGVNDSLPLCVTKDTDFHGRESVDEDIQSMTYLEDTFSDTLLGGRWKPTNCKAKNRVAIIVPYRDRDANLKVLLNNLIPKLRRQNVDYTFYIVEQGTGSNFNRGMMRNIGFVEARKDYNYDCYIFNDVDTVIEDDRNIYTCAPGAALHLAVKVDVFRYQLLYNQLVGGILSFTEDVFRNINGYSNFYFVWGGEDDDLNRRINSKKSQVVRPPLNITYVTTLGHERDPELPDRYVKYHNGKYFMSKDGLNTLKYDLLIVERKRLFTWVYVNVNETYYQEMFNQYKDNLVKKTVWGTFKRKVKVKNTIFS